MSLPRSKESWAKRCDIGSRHPRQTTSSPARVSASPRLTWLTPISGINHRRFTAAKDLPASHRAIGFFSATRKTFLDPGWPCQLSGVFLFRAARRYGGGNSAREDGADRSLSSAHAAAEDRTHGHESRARASASYAHSSPCGRAGGACLLLFMLRGGGWRLRIGSSRHGRRQDCRPIIHRSFRDRAAESCSTVGRVIHLKTKAIRTPRTRLELRERLLDCSSRRGVTTWAAARPSIPCQRSAVRKIKAAAAGSSASGAVWLTAKRGQKCRAEATRSPRVTTRKAPRH